MDSIVKLKRLALFLGDIAALYLSLFIMLFLRYGGFSGDTVKLHFAPFTIIFSLWVIVFYISDLYDLRLLKNTDEVARRVLLVISINAVLGICFFYFIPGFFITPKTNFFLFIAIFAFVGYGWRWLYNSVLNRRLPMVRILLLGHNKSMEEVADQCMKNPQLGYEIKLWLKESLHEKQFKTLSTIITANNIDLIVVPEHIKRDSRAAHLIYKNLALGIEVVDLASMYQKIFKKIPLAELEEAWFLENLTRNHKIYDAFTRPLEVIFAVALVAITLPLTLLIALGIVLTSAGPIIFSQRRVGYRGREFTIYKFRTMRHDAEKDGPQWAAKKDARSTPFGHFLRRTHLDEFPQLLNVITGDLSLVGPRPERPEFVLELIKEIPYYELRHLIRPGVTGWAQTHYRYGASFNDAYEKLQYDLYYIKRRSFFLDMITIVKTIKFFFTNF